MDKEKTALVLYSGGLDSRLAVKLLLDQGFKVTALHFNLPFGCGCCNFGCNFSFAQKEGVKMKIIDVTKEPHLSKYLKLIIDPKYGRGTSINPCKDCKLFIYLEAGKYAKENNIDLIASGEVLGQRPMSQVKNAMKIIDDNIDYELLRPLSAKLLPETIYEKSGLINRDKLLGIKGRNRKEQIALAKKYNISYPNPGGGCFLCEVPSLRLIPLIKEGFVNESTLPLTLIGRHFLIDNIWFVVSRNSKEGNIIEKFENSILGKSGSPDVYYSDEKKSKKAKELQIAFSKGNNNLREKFDKSKI